MLGFSSQRKSMSNLLSMDTHILYSNRSLSGTLQGLLHSNGRRRLKKQKVERRELDEPVTIVDQMVWSPYKRRRGRPKRTFNEVIQRDLLMKGLLPSMTIDRAQ